MTIPNLITLARLLLVPLIVWLIVSDKPIAAFTVFVLAGLSDAVDGFLARQFSMWSALGAYLDPLADKALLVSIYITLAVLAEIPAWVTILIVSRDILIIGGVVLAWMLGQPIEVRPHPVSKANTVAQIVLAAVVLGDQAFAPDLHMLRTILVWVVGLLTIASALVYLYDWVRHMNAGVPAAPRAANRIPGEGEKP